MAYETKKITLPSKGSFGGYEDVTIRNMTGADEKIVYSSVSEASIDRLLSRCIVEPKDIVVSELCEPDKYYILMQIRILTFGSLYKFMANCPECNAKVEVEIDLDELDVYYADEDFDKSLKTTLFNGDEITFKILTSKDVNEVNNLVARLKARNDKGTQLLLQQAAVIKTINGQEKPLVERQHYLEECSSKDVNKMWRDFAKVHLGVNMMTMIECPVCGNTVEVPVSMNSEFFRPTINDEE